MPTINDNVLEQLFEISTPHMKAINEAVEKAFPDIHPDITYTAALACQLGVLLQVSALNADDEARPRAVALINSILVNIGYRLAELEVGGHA